MNGLGTKTVKNLFWNYGTFVANKLLVLVTTFILAKLLDPEDFGLLAVSVILLEYLENIRNFGLDAALIYSKEDVDKASNTTFVLGLASGLILTLLAFFSAGLVADFFNDDRITPIVQALSISLFINNLGNTHQARITKSLNFKRLAFLEASRALVKGVASIAFALAGFGVWSLVWGRIIGVIWSVVVYWWAEKWIPNLSFDWKIARPMLAYGFQIILIGFQAVIFNNVDYLIIGRRMDPEQLGLYTMAFRMPELLIIGFVFMLGQILFPTYSANSADKDAMGKTYLRVMRYVALVVVPLGFGLFLIAQEFVLLFLNEDWTPSIPVTQVLSIYAVIYAMGYNAGDIFKASGKPGILNQIAVVRVIVIVPILWVAAGYSIVYVAYGQLLVNIFVTLLSVWVVTRLVKVSFMDIFKATLPAFAGGIVMLAGVYLLRAILPELPLWLTFGIISLSGAGLYMAAMWFFDNPTCLEVLKYGQIFKQKLASSSS